MAKTPLTSEISGTVWKILAAAGDTVAEDQELMILESMKMEIPVLAPRGGVLVELLVKETDAIVQEQTLAWIE